MQKSRIFWALIWSAFAESVNKLAPFITLHIVESRLGLIEFGRARFAINIIEIAIPFVIFGFGTAGAITLGQPRRRQDEQATYVSSVIALRMLHALIAATALLVITGYFPAYQTYRLLVGVFLFTLFTTALDLSFVSVSRQKMASLGVVTVFAKLFSVAAVMVYVKSPDDAVFYGICALGANSLINLGSFFIGWRELGNFFRFAPTFLRQRWVDAAPYACATILLIFVERLDFIGVSIVGDPESLALYAGSASLMQAVMPLVWSITMVFFSEMVSIEDEESLLRHFRWGLASVFMVIVPIVMGTFLVGSDLLDLIYSGSFRSANKYLQIQMIGLLPHALSVVLGMKALAIRGNIRWFNSSLLCGAIIGIIGVAWGYYFNPTANFMAWIGVVSKFSIAIACIIGVSTLGISMPWDLLFKVFVAGGIMVLALRLSHIPGLWPSIILGGLIYVSVIAVSLPELGRKVIRAISKM